MWSHPTSSPAYCTFLETTEKYTLQIQVLFVFHVPEFPRVPESPRAASHVPESHVPESHVPESHVPESHFP